MQHPPTPLACEQALRLEPVQRLPPQCLCNPNFQKDQKHFILLYFCRCRCPAHSQNFSPGLQAYPWVSRPLFFYFQSRYVISFLRNVKVLHQEIARFTNSPASSVNCFDPLPPPLLLSFFCLVPRLSSAAKDHVEPECAFEVGKNLTVFIEQCISLLHYT